LATKVACKILMKLTQEILDFFPRRHLWKIPEKTLNVITFPTFNLLNTTKKEATINVITFGERDHIKLLLLFIKSYCFGGRVKVDFFKVDTRF